MPHLLIRVLFSISAALYSFNADAAECEHVFSNNWGSGFQAEVQITNTGTTPITSFTISWSYTDNTTVTHVWNADSTGTNPVTATSPVWFPPLAPGATWSIGVNANGAGAGVVIKGDVCGSASANTATLQLAKTWVNGPSGDQITATTTGLANNATITSLNSGSNTDTGTAVQVTVGETATLPAETFISGVAADYSSGDWVCDDAANSIVSAGGTLPISATDAGNTITCTVTNKFVGTQPDVMCEHIITNDFGSGFQASFRITNTSSAPITNWTATWGYSDGTTITNLYNANSTGTNPVTATPPGFFTSLAPGATFNFGFIASGSGNLSSLSCSTTPVVSAAIVVTLTKQLTNDHGGSAAATDWILEANIAGGAAELSGQTGVTSSTLVAGDYELSETGPAGYSQTNLSCDSAVLNGTTLTVAAGDNVNCTFHNDDLPAALTLVKVVNNNIGTATVNDWTLDASLNGSSILNGTSGAPGVTSASLSAGTYTLSETGGPSGYRLESLNCDTGLFNVSTNTLILANGEAAVCTFTNRDIVTDVSVIKSVDDNTPNIGDIITYTLVLSNSGPDSATNILIEDILPAGLSFVAGSMTGGDVQNQSAPNLQWTINNIGVGASNNLSLQYQATVLNP